VAALAAALTGQGAAVQGQGSWSVGDGVSRTLRRLTLTERELPLEALEGDATSLDGKDTHAVQRLCRSAERVVTLTYRLPRGHLEHHRQRRCAVRACSSQPQPAPSESTF